MARPTTPDSGTFQAAASPFSHSTGDEPLPGYVLTEPLGRGGFGEVWACVAPGGLKKAVKFVSAGDDGEAAQFRQEFDAFEQIKEIRHPFLLSLERVEVVGNELVMVMELADEQLLDRFKACRAANLPGIPRPELLGYLLEAAEALDVISAKYGLQHLDVKPANLFVTAGHVKVGDYGLVAKLDTAGGTGHRGLTPKYVAPEVLQGKVHTRSDQYSLALVYCELLTGTFPYPARTPQQMMLAHVSSKPDVSALPDCDRGPVWAALQKRPEDRFPSCVEFVRTMLGAEFTGSAALTPGPASAAGRSTVIPRVTLIEATPAPSADATGRNPRPGSVFTTSDPRADQPTQQSGRLTLPRLTTPGAATADQLRGLVTTRRDGPATQPATTPDTTPDLPLAEPVGPARVRVNPIRSVIPAGLLRGEDLPRAAVSADEFALAVVRAAAGGAHVPELAGDLGRTAGGAWVCQFPSTVPAQVAGLKLSVMKETWKVTIDTPDPGRLVLRRLVAGGWFGKKNAGFEVLVQLPKPGRSLGEVTLTGAIFGEPDKPFVQVAQDVIPRLLADVRRELANVQDRRRHPRVAAGLGLTVHPLHSDGHADPAVTGGCLDVSAGGVAFTTKEPLATKYAYLEFADVPEAAGLAILTRVIRTVSPAPGRGPVYGVQYRTDL
jgi:serine/threonine protein kinase